MSEPCRHKSSDQTSKRSAKETSSRCKHGAQKPSNGTHCSNKKCSKRNSTEKKNQMSSKPLTDTPDNVSDCQSQEIKKIGSFRKDSSSTRGSGRLSGSRSSTLQTGSSINIEPKRNSKADNVPMQNCTHQPFIQQKTSPLNVSAESDNCGDSKSQGSEGKVVCPSCSQQFGADMNKPPSINQENDSSIGKYIEIPPPVQDSGRRSSASKKCCSFKLPGSVCDVPDDECEDTPDCEDEPSQNESIDEGKKGTYKTLKFHKNPTTVTNLREKIQQYVTNRPDQIKPAPKKLTPFSDPVTTECFEPIDEELERQLREEQEAARRLMEERKLEAEIQCYKKVIPFSLPCKTQLEYLDCLGATKAARRKYMEYSKLMKEAECFKKRMPSDWSCEQQTAYLECMGVREEVKEVLACGEPETDTSQCGSVQKSIDPNEQQNGGQTSSSCCGGQEQDIFVMIENCKKEFRSSGINGSSRSSPIPPPPTSSPIKPETSNQKPDERRSSYARGGSMSRGGIENSYAAGVANNSFSTGVANNSYTTRVSNNSYATGVANNSYDTGVANNSYATGVANNSYATGVANNSYDTGVSMDTSTTKPSASFHQGSFEVEDDDDPSDTESDMNHPMFGHQEEVAKPTLAEEMRLYKSHLANIRKRYFGAFCKEMENAETITPDIAAAMVYSGDLGISMKSAPEKVYDFLYPDAPGNQIITIADVVANLPKGLDDIVVPIIPPITIQTQDYPEIEDPAMLDSPRVIQVGPALNLIDEPEVKGLLDPVDIKELVTGHTSANYLELMFPETADMELEEEEDTEEQKEERAKTEMFNIKLVNSLPQHFSQVQMRGSIPPNWFPGYWSASPSREGVRKSLRPADVMEYVWEEMQPERVRPAGAAYIIGN